MLLTKILMKKLFRFAAVASIAALLAAPALHAQDISATVPASDAVYQALGGKAGLQKIVREFHERVLADDRIKASFADSDHDRLKKMLNEQLCQLSGGPCKYSGKDMKLIHEDLKITNAQFNALAEDLQITMENNGVPAAAQNKLIAKLAPMQRDIVTK